MTNKEPNDAVSAFLQADREWLNMVIESYPRQIPVAVLAEHWGCAVESVRAAIEQSPTFGVYWHKVGKNNRSYLIPTGVFMRWYCKQNY